MVATADRSPARYIFELKWRKCRAARFPLERQLPPPEHHRALEKLTESSSNFLDRASLGGFEAVEHPGLHSHRIRRERPAPGAADLPPNGDDVGKDAAERDRRRSGYAGTSEDCRVERKIRVQNLRSIAEGVRVLVVVGQQVGDRSRLFGRARARIKPVVPSLDDPGLERRPRDPNAGAGIGHPEAGPPDEVLELGRAM